MHSKQYKCHWKKVQILPVNYVPLIAWEWLVDVHIRQQTEREYDDSQVYPTEKQHENDKSCHQLMLGDIGLEVEPGSCHKDITGIVDDKDHNSCSDFVAHHWKEYQRGSYKVMKHPFIVLPIVFLEDY